MAQGEVLGIHRSHIRDEILRLSRPPRGRRGEGSGVGGHGIDGLQEVVILVRVLGRRRPRPTFPGGDG